MRKITKKIVAASLQAKIEPTGQTIPYRSPDHRAGEVESVIL
jgi:hypothetical protein